MEKSEINSNERGTSSSSFPSINSQSLMEYEKREERSSELQLIESEINEDGKEKKPLLFFGSPSSNSSFSVLSKPFVTVYNIFMKDSLMAATFNLSNTSIGSGILFLPFIIYECGVIPSLVFLAVGGFLCSSTLYFLHCSYERVTDQKAFAHVQNYEEIGLVIFGGRKSFLGNLAELTIQICVTCVNFGCSVTYIIVISHLLAGWIENKLIHAIVLFCICQLILMVAFVPSIKYLSMLSYVSITGMFVFIILICFCFWIGLTDDNKKGETMYLPNFKVSSTYVNMLSNLGIVTFSYACHSNFCPISQEFTKKNRWKMGIGLFLSILTDYSVYALVAIFGYLSFIDNTEKDIIESYKGRNAEWVYSVLRSILVVAMVSTYPLTSFPCRLTVVNFWKGMYRKVKKTDDVPKWFYLPIYIVTTVSINFISFLIAVLYPDANDLISLIGSTCCVFTVYIMPCLFYIKTYHLKVYHFKFWVVVAIGTFGTIMGILITASTLYSLVTGIYLDIKHLFQKKK